MVVEEGGAGFGVGDQAAGRRCGRGVQPPHLARAENAHCELTRARPTAWVISGIYVACMMMPVFFKGGHVAFEELLRWTGVLHLE